MMGQRTRTKESLSSIPMSQIWWSNSVSQINSTIPRGAIRWTADTNPHVFRVNHPLDKVAFCG